MDRGLDMNVGPKGVRLSGGQVQRAAALRAFAREPELLDFDDLSTSRRFSGSTVDRRSRAHTRAESFAHARWTFPQGPFRRHDARREPESTLTSTDRTTRGACSSSEPTPISASRGRRFPTVG